MKSKRPTKASRSPERQQNAVEVRALAEQDNGTTIPERGQKHYVVGGRVLVRTYPY